MISLYDYCKENNKDYLLDEWDYELNTDFNVKTILSGSNKKVWWKCSFCGHKWQTTIYHRTINGSSCPKCYHSKRKSFVKNKNLAITNPEITQDWHTTKNGKLTPEMFTKDSRYKVWWKCHICGKEIETEIKNYSGCATCKKQIILNERNLKITHPHLIEEWNYKKNTILPDEILASSPKKVWWKCKKCDYEWQAKISNRAMLDRNCPCCTNKTVVPGINDLVTTHSDIAKEWHPTKNGNLTPQKVTHGSGKKVWWLCPQGHEYQATVLHRTQDNGTNCPICNSGRQTSFAEQAVYYYVKKYYPDAINRYTAYFLGKMELDIYIPSIRYAIEYDGEAWHKKDKIKREQRKYKICKDNGIKLIRLREIQSEPLSQNCDIEISRENLYKFEILEPTIYFLLDKLRITFNPCFGPIMYDINIERDKQEILQYKTILKKDSLQDTFPKIASEWHPTKNGNLTPKMFNLGSNHKVWWKCSVCNNEWEASIGSRTRGTGCPKCGIEKSTKVRRKPVNMIDKKTNKIIQTFISISDASRKMNINSSNISMVCKGQRNYAGGYKWEYAD